jgi:hypothetical protein
MKYRTKPVVKEALQLNHENLPKIWEWMGEAYHGHGETGDDARLSLPISTLEGVMTAYEGDFIIKGLKGEFYPCKPEIFEATYEAVSS